MTTLRLFLALTFVGSAGLAGATADSAAQLTAERVANENARAAARQGNVALAEQLLTAVNRAQPATSWWHVETAQRLIHLAHDMPRHLSNAVIPAIVSRTLEHLSQAETMNSVPRQKSAIRAMTAMVHERFRGDHASALAAYRAAAQFAPDNQLAARAADRLQRTAENTAARARK